MTYNREDIIKYFEELCGPHLDPDIYTWSTADLIETYIHSLCEMEVIVA